MKRSGLLFLIGHFILSSQAFALDRVCSYHMVCKGVSLSGKCPCASPNSAVCKPGSVTSLCDGTSAGGALSGSSSAEDLQVKSINKAKKN